MKLKNNNTDSHIWLFMLKRFGGKRMQEKMDQWINWVEYDELLEGRHNAPHNLLGLHSFGRGQVLTVYRPEAERVFITDMSGKNELELEEIGEGSGFFGKYIPRKNYRAPYKVKVQYSENDVIEYVDPYCCGG